MGERRGKGGTQWKVRKTAAVPWTRTPVFVLVAVLDGKAVNVLITEISNFPISQDRQYIFFDIVLIIGLR